MTMPYRCTLSQKVLSDVPFGIFFGPNGTSLRAEIAKRYDDKGPLRMQFVKKKTPCASGWLQALVSRSEATEQADEHSSQIGFDAYGLTAGTPDPVALSINSMRERIEIIDQKMAYISQKLQELDSSFTAQSLPVSQVKDAVQSPKTDSSPQTDSDPQPTKPLS